MNVQTMQLSSTRSERVKEGYTLTFTSRLQSLTAGEVVQKKFNGRHQDFIEKCQRSVNTMVNYSFQEKFYFYIQEDFSQVFIVLNGFVTWICQYFI